MEEGDMEFSVKLAALPPGLAFPERLRERVSFDPTAGRFVYRGFMTKCTYDELSALSDDPDYHRALEQLFVLTSSEMAPRPARSLSPAILLATIGSALLAVIALWAMTRHATAEKPSERTSTATVSTAS